MTNLRFSALDTWFFREARPMDAIGGSELVSRFPPPPRTLLGALRTAIGDGAGADWKAFADNADDPLRARIGYRDDLGPLVLSGPWVCEGGDRLYPVPLFLLEKTLNGRTDLSRLKIGRAVDSYLGRVRLPELPTDRQGFKPVDRAWLGREALEAVLGGNIPNPTSIRREADLFKPEPRLGIARDNTRRIAEEGLLYQTRHLRPRNTVALEADVIPDSAISVAPTMVRLGGEGRLAYLEYAAPARFPAAPKPSAATRGLILVLLTSARFGSGAEAWLLPEFRPTRQSDGTWVWTGEIAGIGLTVHSAVIGKALREGGWDLAEGRPRAVQSLIPAGSAYYVTVEGVDLKKAITALHRSQIGEDQKLGRGLMACALWNINEF